MNEKRRKHIFIAEDEHGLPYSKGLTASSLMVTGLGPARSYAVANKVEQELLSLDKRSYLQSDCATSLSRSSAGTWARSTQRRSSSGSRWPSSTSR